MNNNQITLLNELAKKIANQRLTKKAILTSLQSAKIINSKGDFTRQYSNLRKVVASK
jgi:polysaccharide pyruvyl transferase WcaK-like protein